MRHSESFRSPALRIQETLIALEALYHISSGLRPRLAARSRPRRGAREKHTKTHRERFSKHDPLTNPTYGKSDTEKLRNYKIVYTTHKTHIHTHTHIHAYTCIHAYTYTYTYTCIHINIHIHIHIHIHMHRQEAEKIYTHAT